jgi:ABC-type multidrug transport system fused ATPase/permease subunit
MTARRRTTVRDALHVLEHGRCVASGTNDDLVADTPIFRALAQA